MVFYFILNEIRNIKKVNLLDLYFVIGMIYVVEINI